MKFLKPFCVTSFLVAGAAPAEPHLEMSIPLDWALKTAIAASETCAEMGFATTGRGSRPASAIPGPAYA